MDPIADLAEEIIADVLEKALTRPHQQPAPTGEDREDRSSYYVRNIMPSMIQDERSAEDRDDDR